MGNATGAEERERGNARKWEEGSNARGDARPCGATGSSSAPLTRPQSSRSVGSAGHGGLTKGREAELEDAEGGDISAITDEGKGGVTKGEEAEERR